MSAITGYIDYNVKEISEKEAKNSLYAESARGGVQCIYNTAHCVLGELTEKSNSPSPFSMVSPTGDTYVIVLDGVIYNTEELRQKAHTKGYFIKSENENELLICLYMAYGKDCLSMINGVFSLAIWNDSKKELLIARDFAGVKPLFCYINTKNRNVPRGTFLAFASELKGLFQYKNVPKILNHESIAQLVFLGPARKPGSGVYKDIIELLPGECAVFSEEKGLTRYVYKKLTAEPHQENFPETAYHLKGLIISAINRQITMEKPLCCFLSGGLDSSIITAVVAKCFSEKGKTLTTYSLDYEDNSKYFSGSMFQPDEDAPFIKAVSEFCNTNHINTVLKVDEIADGLIPAVLARDLPGMADIDSTLMLFCREVKKNFSAVFSGECADEILGGYPWYHNEEMLFEEGFPWSRSILPRAMLLRDGAAGKIDPLEYVDSIYKKTVSETDYLDTDSEKDRRVREMFMLNWKHFMQVLTERKDTM